MSEMIFLGGCPVIRPEGIYVNGRRVIRLGLEGAIGLGDVGDLLSYRQMWEPFIKAHLELWRDMNARFENSPDVRRCPAGIFKNSDIKDPDPVWRSWCASLALTRMMTSTTDQDGILPRWNAWANKTSAQMVTGAPDMLKWLQSVVLQVGNSDKDKLLSVAKAWGIDVTLPGLPSFDLQRDLIARTEGAYITTKGVLQILGYGAGETLRSATDIAQATAQGLKETAQDIPRTTRWVAIAGVIVAVIVGGVLITYYVPRHPKRKELPA
jgi:hypothetical protein